LRAVWNSTPADGADAHWESNPYAIAIAKRPLRKGDTRKVLPAASGCVAVWFVAQN
jgi:hypothetical protein